MTRYVLDTNVYVEAFRSEHAAAELVRFYAAYAPALVVSSVVVFELLVGCNTTVKMQQVERLVVDPFRRTSRVLTPSAWAWEGAGNAIAAMCRAERRTPGTLPKSLANDFLLAASCREHGVMLVTFNTSDFELIRKWIPVRFSESWPA